MITTTQAAKILQVTPRRVLALINSGRLPAQRPGRDWLINPKDLKLVQDRRPGYPAGRPRNKQHRQRENK